MAAAGHYVTDIYKAADLLRTQGINPSVRRVREHLGGGSMERIARHLKDWRSRQPDAPEHEESTSDRITAAVSAVYDLLLNEAQQDLSDRAAPGDNLLKDAAEKLTQADTQIEQIVALNKENEAQLSQQRAENGDLKEQLTAMNIELAAARGRLETMDRDRRAFEKLQDDHQGLQQQAIEQVKEMNRERACRQSEVERRLQTENLVGAKEQELQTLNSNLQTQLSELEKQRSQIEQLCSQVHEYEMVAQQQQQRAARQSAELDAERQRVIDLLQRCQDTEVHFVTTQEQLSALMAASEQQARRLIYVTEQESASSKALAIAEADVLKLSEALLDAQQQNQEGD